MDRRVTTSPRITSEDIDRGAAPNGRATVRERPRLLGELVVVATLLLVYDRVRSLAEVHTSVAIAHGRAILDFEAILHLRVEHWLNSVLTERGALRFLAVEYYQFMHVTVALTMLVICYTRFPEVYRPARTALVLTNLVGLAIFAVYPAAPPRLLPDAGFVDSVAAAGFGSSHGPIPADQFGALPSLHLAWATWVAFTGFAITRRLILRVLLAGHVLITAFVVVATANHYILDVASGALLGFLAVTVVGVRSPVTRASARQDNRRRVHRNDSRQSTPDTAR